MTEEILTDALRGLISAADALVDFTVNLSQQVVMACCKVVGNVIFKMTQHFKQEKIQDTDADKAITNIKYLPEGIY